MAKTRKLKRNITVRLTKVVEAVVSVDGEQGWTEEDYRNAAIERCKAFPHRLNDAAEEWIATEEGH